MKKGKGYIALTITIAIILIGCKKKQIEGIVLNNFKQPLTNVNISIEGTSFEAVSDKDGKYYIDYVPGDIKISYEKDGYISESLKLNINTKEKFPAKTIVMTEIPQEGGIFFVDYETFEYLKINYGELRRDHIKNPDCTMLNWTRVPGFYNYYYCSGKYTSLSNKSKTKEFVINSPKNFNLYSIQKENGLFYRHEEYGLSSKWYANIIEMNKKNKGSLKLITVNLDKGKYCFTTNNENFNYPEEPLYMFEIK